ncbi:MAG: curved DNA-binding protein [Actinomycetota bacterium]|nr:curved DNA-binding protein [Actinomycetota bacterium]
MTSHYDVLGVPASASYDDIRAAYHQRAQALHPDRVALRPAGEQDTARRAMQDVNEAWRILRDAPSRAAYDSAMARAAAPAPAAPAAPSEPHGWDEPYRGAVAEPGDIAVAFVRAAPWVAIVVVLDVIVVFTAFARHTESPRALIGSCISTTDGVPHEVPCDEPNDGKVVDVVDTQAACASDTTARVMASGHWFCLTE